MKNVKQLIPFLLSLFFPQFSSAQANGISGEIKCMFEGTWIYQPEDYTDTPAIKTDTLVINFDQGKDYATATVLDIGTGEEPAIAFKAKVKDNMLVILPIHHENDFRIEMEVIKGILYFRQKLIIWDNKGNPVELKVKDDSPLTKKYRRRNENK